VRLSNTERPPGSTAFAEAAFSGGQAGPFVTETLDALGSARRVTALIADYEDAVRACRSLTLTVPGQGRSTFAVRVVRAPETSSPTFAARFSATGGALEGLELTFVLAAVEDVVVTTTFVGATPEDVEGGAGLAVDKAVEVLGAGAGGA
jgi:hypothetical protein